jgi:hypothetical protein
MLHRRCHPGDAGLEGDQRWAMARLRRPAAPRSGLGLRPAPGAPRSAQDCFAELPGNGSSCSRAAGTATGVWLPSLVLRPPKAKVVWSNRAGFAKLFKTYGSNRAPTDFAGFHRGSVVHRLSSGALVLVVGIVRVATLVLPAINPPRKSHLPSHMASQSLLADGVPETGVRPQGAHCLEDRGVIADLSRCSIGRATVGGMRQCMACRSSR